MPPEIEVASSSNSIPDGEHNEEGKYKAYDSVWLRHIFGEGTELYQKCEK